jgi:serine/threonine protein kinase
MTNCTTRYNTHEGNNPLLYSSSDVQLDHFKILKVIGRGSFGKVYLV